jgi:hypothetical protein
MRISGRVERDGQPVAGALVRADMSSATTDERGEYALNRVTPGQQSLWVRVDEEFHQFEVNLPEETNITLPSAQATAAGDGESTPDSGGGERRTRRRNTEQE